MLVHVPVLIELLGAWSLLMRSDSHGVIHLLGFPLLVGIRTWRKTLVNTTMLSLGACG